MALKYNHIASFNEGNGSDGVKSQLPTVEGGELGEESLSRTDQP